jgi:hypothetical protein
VLTCAIASKSVYKISMLTLTNWYQLVLIYIFLNIYFGETAYCCMNNVFERCSASSALLITSAIYVLKLKFIGSIYTTLSRPASPIPKDKIEKQRKISQVKNHKYKQSSSREPLCMLCGSRVRKVIHRYIRLTMVLSVQILCVTVHDLPFTRAHCSKAPIIQISEGRDQQNAKHLTHDG